MGLSLSGVMYICLCTALSAICSSTMAPIRLTMACSLGHQAFRHRDLLGQVIPINPTCNRNPRWPPAMDNWLAYARPVTVARQASYPLLLHHVQGHDRLGSRVSLIGSLLCFVDHRFRVTAQRGAAPGQARATPQYGLVSATCVTSSESLGKASLSTHGENSWPDARIFPGSANSA